MNKYFFCPNYTKQSLILSSITSCLTFHLLGRGSGRGKRAGKGGKVKGAGKEGGERVTTV